MYPLFLGLFAFALVQADPHSLESSPHYLSCKNSTWDARCVVNLGKTIDPMTMTQPMSRADREKICQEIAVQECIQERAKAADRTGPQTIGSQVKRLRPPSVRLPDASVGTDGAGKPR